MARNITVITNTGGVILLKNAFALGQDHIGHDGGTYAIQYGDTFKMHDHCGAKHGTYTCDRNAGHDGLHSHTFTSGQPQRTNVPLAQRTPRRRKAIWTDAYNGFRVTDA